MNKVWFFDLEETIIESWHDPLLCNVNRVRSFIDENKITEVHIFSAAIWNENDCAFFRDNFKSWLEDVFNIKILTWISMEHVWKNTTWKGTRFENVTEMIGLIGKKRMFEDWCLQTQDKGSHCVLLDDSFGNTVLINKDLDIVVETVDVTKL